MNKSEMLAALKELDPAELRVLKYEMNGGHSCANTTSLYHCCGEARCEACHVPHLKAMHDEPALWAYEKFVGKFQLTWQGYVPTKQKKVTKKGTSRAVRQEPKAALSANSLAASLNDADLDAVLEVLKAKLGKDVVL